MAGDEKGSRIVEIQIRSNDWIDEYMTVTDYSS